MKKKLWKAAGKSVAVVIAMSMMASMSLSGCGLSGRLGGSEDSTQTEQNAADSSSTDVVQQTDADKSQGAGDVNGTYEFSTPMAIVTHNVTCKVDDKECATGKYPEIILSEDTKSKYPKLEARVNEINEKWSASVLETVPEFAYWASTDEYYEGAVFCSELEVYVNRFDDRILSLIVSTYDDGGGAHPSHYNYSINIDPVTGEDLKLSSVLENETLLPPAIRLQLEKNYPGVLEEVDSFYFQYEGDDPDQFKQKLIDDSYTWNVDEKGLYIVFSPYEIASYATGYLEVILTYEEYPDLIQKVYQLDAAPEKDKLYTAFEEEAFEVEPADVSEDDYTGEDYGETNFVAISNPSWKKYVSDSASPASSKHVSLTKTLEDKTDWLDTEVWANKNGFSLKSLPYGDENYCYDGDWAKEFDYMYNELKVYNAAHDTLVYDFGFEELCMGPDQENQEYSSGSSYINWAKIEGDVLYVSIMYAGYASENPWSGYMAAIDLSTKELLWKSEPQVSNASNFVIVDDTLICGYGFTAEPDYIYLLDKYTGDKVEQIKVNSAPYQFEVQGDKLYVATYNTAYEFDITR
ncbi:DUF3298 and DUF4163 domain-containing protein [Butyrivibrio sp. VCB2006]|uniref:DUF3298 and DUF4163 domain-containing protein n=1 Tax=Butyrivibrio sp. VCB2006 TaxID=1280679 RepID=UPI000407496F|nr:DUF3298 and DUF4163 domain-containing protein [Butyrivibrio sp. VCB2006]